jgi:hypothetical protein
MNVNEKIKQNKEFYPENENTGATERSISVSPDRITKILLLIAFLFLCFHMLVVSIGYFDNVPPESTFPKLVNSFYRQFHLAEEGNMPTYYSSFLLGAASFLLYIIFKTDEKKSTRWLLLSLIFLFLSVDELAQLHENFANPLGAKLESYFGRMPSYLAWGWIIPYAIITLVAGLYFLRFVITLPKKTRNLFISSGCLYVFAALILEMLEAHFEIRYGSENLYNKLLYPTEEILEMIGVIIFIYALLDYLRGNRKRSSFFFVIKRPDKSKSIYK